jgi:hypothetical protein
LWSKTRSHFRVPPENDALASTDDKAEALEQVKILVEAVTKLLPLITKFFGF